MLAVNYRPEVMASFLAKAEKDYDVKITFSVEDTPLGTAGPLALARDVLAQDDAPFFVLKSVPSPRPCFEANFKLMVEFW